MQKKKMFLLILSLHVPAKRDPHQVRTTKVVSLFPYFE
jgi:hypothetical protein